MDNFVCWRCQREARGAFMLMGRPKEKWLVERQRQIELALAARWECRQNCSLLDFLATPFWAMPKRCSLWSVSCWLFACERSKLADLQT